MKKSHIAYSIFIACSVGILSLTQFWGKEEKQSAPLIEQRDTSGIDPFAKAARVELVTYKSDRMEWWYDEGDQERPLIQKNGTLNMPIDSIHSRVNIDAQAIARWHSALYAQHFCEETIISLCYQPRHLLLFYTSDNRIAGHIEICFSCAGGRISDGLRDVIFCHERVEYLATLIGEGPQAK